MNKEQIISLVSIRATSSGIRSSTATSRASANSIGLNTPNDLRQALASKQQERIYQQQIKKAEKEAIRKAAEKQQQKIEKDYIAEYENENFEKVKEGNKVVYYGSYNELLNTKTNKWETRKYPAFTVEYDNKGFIKRISKQQVYQRRYGKHAVYNTFWRSYEDGKPKEEHRLDIQSGYIKGNKHINFQTGKERSSENVGWRRNVSRGKGKTPIPKGAVTRDKGGKKQYFDPQAGEWKNTNIPAKTSSTKYYVKDTGKVVSISRKETPGKEFKQKTIALDSQKNIQKATKLEQKRQEEIRRQQTPTTQAEFAQSLFERQGKDVTKLADNVLEVSSGQDRKQVLDLTRKGREQLADLPSTAIVNATSLKKFIKEQKKPLTFIEAAEYPFGKENQTMSVSEFNRKMAFEKLEQQKAEFEKEFYESYIVFPKGTIPNTTSVPETKQRLKTLSLISPSYYRERNKLNQAIKEYNIEFTKNVKVDFDINPADFKIDTSINMKSAWDILKEGVSYENVDKASDLLGQVTVQRATTQELTTVPGYADIKAQSDMDIIRQLQEETQAFYTKETLKKQGEFAATALLTAGAAETVTLLPKAAQVVLGSKAIRYGLLGTYAFTESLNVASGVQDIQQGNTTKGTSTLLSVGIRGGGFITGIQWAKATGGKPITKTARRIINKINMGKTKALTPQEQQFLREQGVRIEKTNKIDRFGNVYDSYEIKPIYDKGQRTLQGGLAETEPAVSSGGKLRYFGYDSKITVNPKYLTTKQASGVRISPDGKITALGKKVKVEMGSVKGTRTKPAPLDIVKDVKITDLEVLGNRLKFKYPEGKVTGFTDVYGQKALESFGQTTKRWIALDTKTGKYVEIFPENIVIAQGQVFIKPSSRLNIGTKGGKVRWADEFVGWRESRFGLKDWLKFRDLNVPQKNIKYDVDLRFFGARQVTKPKPMSAELKALNARLDAEVALRQARAAKAADIIPEQPQVAKTTKPGKSTKATTQASDTFLDLNLADYPIVQVQPKVQYIPTKTAKANIPKASAVVSNNALASFLFPPIVESNLKSATKQGLGVDVIEVEEQLKDLAVEPDLRQRQKEDTSYVSVVDTYSALAVEPKIEQSKATSVDNALAVDTLTFQASSFDYFPSPVKIKTRVDEEPEKPPKQPPSFPSFKRLDLRRRIEGKQQGWDVYSRDRGKKIKLNKEPLNRASALSKGARYVDTTKAATFKLNIAKLEENQKPKETYDDYYEYSKFKFRNKSYKTGEVNKNLFIEKNKYRMDDLGEAKAIRRGDNPFGNINIIMKRASKKRGMLL